MIENTFYKNYKRVMGCSSWVKCLRALIKALSFILITNYEGCGEVGCTKFGFLMLYSQLNIRTHCINLKSFLVMYLEKVWKL